MSEDEALKEEPSSSEEESSRSEEESGDESSSSGSDASSEVDYEAALRLKREITGAAGSEAGDSDEDEPTCSGQDVSQ